MNRDQLEHILRASGSITNESEFVVVGSQALLGTLAELPGVLGRSMEADLYPRRRPELADLIDGSIGEDSPFHQTFGYYAQGVGPETAKLAPGWEDRCAVLSGPQTRGVTGLCLSPVDVASSKAVAGRPKDREFLEAFFAQGFATADEVRERIRSTAVDPAVRDAAERLVLAVLASAGGGA